MAPQTPLLKIAVVGIGPRGLGALEALAVLNMQRGIKIEVDIFDPIAWPGAGPNFDPDQSDICLLNIPLRDLDIAPPEELAGQGYQTFGASQSPDEFPARSALGAYLHQRFCALDQTLLTLHLHRVAVVEVACTDTGWTVSTNDQTLGPYHEVLLTQGQPTTRPDEQLSRWQDHAQTHDLALQSAYPPNQLLEAAKQWVGKSVGVRGLGLSTFDVIRLLTTGAGGAFQNGVYLPSGREPRRIVPFSLNGHPPIPKPATSEIDQCFDLLKQETVDFEQALQATLTVDPDQALDVLCDALVAPVLRILGQQGQWVTETEIRTWLAQERDDPGSQEVRPAPVVLSTGIDMAQGRSGPSIGFTVGQVWRKLQNPLRSGFNSKDHTTDTAAALIAFDEGLKRFSYGPPVSCAEEMLMLLNAGIVDLRAVADPDVTLEAQGWRLDEDEIEMLLPVMVNAVLPGVDLDDVTDPLVTHLYERGALHPFDSGLGAQTAPDGQVMQQDGSIAPGLSLLGRLSLGSVIAADSLHDCFGASATRWAQGVLDRAE